MAKDIDGTKRIKRKCDECGSVYGTTRTNPNEPGYCQECYEKLGMHKRKICPLCGNPEMVSNCFLLTGEDEVFLCVDTDGSIHPHMDGVILIGKDYPDREKIEKILGIKK